MTTQQSDGHPTEEASDLATREHIPVLYEEVLAGLQIQPGRRYIDATLGAGGHTVGILQASTPDGQVLGLDADPAAIAFAREILDPFGARAILQVANFRDLKSTAGSLGFEGVDGILLDLGLSSRQLADAQRGFSFSREGPLDMRFNPNHGQSAADLVNSLSGQRIQSIGRAGLQRHRERDW